MSLLGPDKIEPGNLPSYEFPKQKRLAESLLRAFLQEVYRKQEL